MHQGTQQRAVFSQCHTRQQVMCRSAAHSHRQAKARWLEEKQRLEADVAHACQQLRQVCESHGEPPQHLSMCCMPTVSTDNSDISKLINIWVI